VEACAVVYQTSVSERIFPPLLAVTLVFSVLIFTF